MQVEIHGPDLFPAIEVGRTVARLEVAGTPVVIRPFKVVGTAFHLAHLEIERCRILVADPHGNHIGIRMGRQYTGKRPIHGNDRRYLLRLCQRHFPHHLGLAAAEYEIK